MNSLVDDLKQLWKISSTDLNLEKLDINQLLRRFSQLRLI